MAQPPPEGAASRPLVWAPGDVVVRLREEVQPPVSWWRQAISTAVLALVFTWPLAFVGFAGMVLAAPSVTDRAGLGPAASWALQVAALIAVRAVVGVLWRRGAVPDDAVSTRRRLGRIVADVVYTAACGWLVLAWEGLSTGQIALLCVVLVAAVHLLPVLLARGLGRLMRRLRA